MKLSQWKDKFHPKAHMRPSRSSRTTGIDSNVCHRIWSPLPAKHAQLDARTAAKCLMHAGFAHAVAYQIVLCLLYWKALNFKLHQLLDLTQDASDGFCMSLSP